MRQFTFSRTCGAGTYQWWCTMRFAEGEIFLLSRDPERSTRKVWKPCGRYSQTGVVFVDDNTNTQIAAAALASRGYTVVGATVHGEWSTRTYSPERDLYAERYTVPRTIRKHLGEVPTGDRNRSLDLGVPAKGREIARELTLATFANKADVGEAYIESRRALAARGQA